MTKRRLFESPKACERRQQRLRELAEASRSEYPSTSLISPPPRRLCWRTPAKAMVFAVACMAMSLTVAIPLLVWADRIWGKMAWEMQQSADRVRHRADSETDPQRREKLLKVAQEYEDLDQQRQRLCGRLLVVHLGGLVVMPALQLVFLTRKLREQWRLCREGSALRGKVTRHRWRWTLDRQVEVAYSLDGSRGFRLWQTVDREEQALLTVGSRVWLLVLPDRPSKAVIVGLNRSLFEIEPDPFLGAGKQ